MQDKVKRLSAAYDYLRGRGIVHTQNDVAAIMGANKTNVSYAFNGNEKYLTDSFLKRFNKAFGDIFNIDWLLAGEGDMIKSQSTQANEGRFISNPNSMEVPMISKFAYAGYQSGFGDDEYIDTLPTYTWLIPDEHPHRGEYRSLEVRGDSMDDGSYNSIIDGDVLLCRVIEQHLWADSKLHLHKWKNFVIVTNEGILVKQITDHNVEKGTITIHSLNPMYDDHVLELRNVRQIMNVVKYTREPR